MLELYCVQSLQKQYEEFNTGSFNYCYLIFEYFERYERIVKRERTGFV